MPRPPDLIFRFRILQRLLLFCLRESSLLLHLRRRGRVLVDVIYLQSDFPFDLRKHAALLQREINQGLGASFDKGVSGDLDFAEKSVALSGLLVVVEIDFDDLGGHGVVVVDEKLKLLVPLGIEIFLLGLGPPPLSVEVDDGVGAGRSLAVFRH